MLYELMRECRNYFAVKGAEIVGNFVIADGSIEGLELIPGQYYIIDGSIFNDGLHKFGGEETLQDESFSGVVHPLAVPKAFLKLSEDVEAWQEKNGNVSAFSSESFGGYSYTRATNSKGNAFTWRDAFATDLAQWRRL